MTHDSILKDRLDALREAGQNWEFVGLQRRAGQAPFVAGPDGRLVAIWCTNDYLAMGQHPAVTAAAHEAIDAMGVGSGGSRNISGTTPLHQELEAELADLHRRDAALTFVSGYSANDATLSTLGRLFPDAIVFSDERNHASMIEGSATAAPTGTCSATTTRRTWTSCWPRRRPPAQRCRVRIRYTRWTATWRSSKRSATLRTATAR